MEKGISFSEQLGLLLMILMFLVGASMFELGILVSKLKSNIKFSI
jgi:hypothetical protein